MVHTIFASINILEHSKKTSHFSMGYFYDESKKLSIDVIENQSFVPSKSQFTYGFKSGNLWFKLEINNQSLNEDFILSFSEPYFSDVILYTKEENIWNEEKNGINIPLDKRSILNHNPTFSLHIKKNTNKVIYLKMHSKLTTSGEFEIYSENYFNSIGGHYQDLLYMLFYGAIFIVSLMNLFLYFRLKESLYLFYSGYIFFYILWAASYSGHILYLGVDGFYHKFIMVTPMFIMFMILFSAQFLNVQKVLPNIYKSLNMFAYTFGFLALLITISFEPWFEVMNALASLLFLVLFVVAFLVLKKTNDVNIKYYLFAMTVYMITVSLMSAMVNGWIQNNDINRYSFLFGSLFEILFFALILTNRFHVLQTELLEVKTQSELLLQKEVKDKTEDINTLLIEKELLLQELYHRVKNNFHLIIGLLWMEKNNAKDTIIKELFQKMLFRIKSMSLIHQYLYENDSIKNFDTYGYINKIIYEIKSVYESDKIIIDAKIEPIQLDAESALSIGMIINELLNNSIKYNAKNDKKTTIKIMFVNDDKYIRLRVCDDGVGFDTQEKQNGLGLSLIKQLSQKLPQSNYTLKSENGVEFELVFQSHHQ